MKEKASIAANAYVLREHPDLPPEICKKLVHAFIEGIIWRNEQHIELVEKGLAELEQRIKNLEAGQ